MITPEQITFWSKTAQNLFQPPLTMSTLKLKPLLNYQNLHLYNKMIPSIYFLKQILVLALYIVIVTQQMLYFYKRG